MAKNPLIRRSPKMTGKLTGGHKSAGILDDHAIRKNIATKEGTIEKVPVNDSDIVNKKYADTQDDTKLDKDGGNADTTIDIGSEDLTTTGKGTFGNLDVDTLNLNGNTISDSSGTINFETWHTRIWDGDETTVFDINYDEDYSTTAIGVVSEAEERGIAIGDGSSAGEEALSFGDSTETEGVSALALGGGAIAIGYKSIAIGGDAEANSDDDLENEGCIAIGEEAYAGNERAIAIGQSTSAGYTDSWAIGTNAETTASGQGVLSARNIIFNPIPSSVDIVMTFMGSSNVGVFKWMEDEDYFEFEDDVVVDGSISSSTKTITASADDTDVSGVNTLFIDSNAGNIVVGGLKGGITGQVLYVAVTDISNDVTLENEEGIAGSQDLKMYDRADETIDNGGGWTMICDGTDWYDCSHAKHV